MKGVTYNDADRARKAIMVSLAEAEGGGEKTEGWMQGIIKNMGTINTFLMSGKKLDESKRNELTEPINYFIHDLVGRPQDLKLFKECYTGGNNEIDIALNEIAVPNVKAGQQVINPQKSILKIAKKNTPEGAKVRFYTETTVTTVSVDLNKPINVGGTKDFTTPTWIDDPKSDDGKPINKIKPLIDKSTPDIIEEADSNSPSMLANEARTISSSLLPTTIETANNLNNATITKQPADLTGLSLSGRLRSASLSALEKLKTMVSKGEGQVK